MSREPFNRSVKSVLVMKMFVSKNLLTFQDTVWVFFFVVSITNCIYLNEQRYTYIQGLFYLMHIQNIHKQV